VTSIAPKIGGKRLELLREVVPDISHIAVLWNALSPGQVIQEREVLEMGEVQATSRSLGLEGASLEIRSAEDIAPAIEALKSRAEALYVCSEPLSNTNRIRINTLALGARLPTMHGVREMVEAGGLMAMEPTSRTCSGAPLTMSTKFCVARSQVTFRSSSRPNSISSST
jgi:putative ABC transport system substrate-binding protein